MLWRQARGEGVTGLEDDSSQGEGGAGAGGPGAWKKTGGNKC